MRLKTTLSRLAATALLALAGTAQAAIVNGADVGGFRTFVDTSTGRVWADLDNHRVQTSTGYAYRFADYDEYLDALTAAGFVWAFAGEVALLMQAYPLATGADRTAAAATMSTLASLSAGEIAVLTGYSEYFSGDSFRQFATYDPGTDTAWWADSGIGSPLPTALEGSGLWAYLVGPGGGGGGSVPLPGTLGLAGLGLVALAGRRRATA